MKLQNTTNFFTTILVIILNCTILCTSNYSESVSIEEDTDPSISDEENSVPGTSLETTTPKSSTVQPQLVIHR